ncbi:MAG: hypothetical protein AB7L70_08335 [Pyrinomonadaceae bacterium]
MVDKSSRIVGAGGAWKVIDERPDERVVRQITPLSCVAAAGEMLLRARGISIPQQEILDIIREPSSIGALANFLNEVDAGEQGKKWFGSIIERRNISLLLREGPFGVVLRDGTPLGHLVVVPKAQGGRLEICDSWEGTSYELSFFELFRHWNGEAVFKWSF